MTLLHICQLASHEPLAPQEEGVTLVILASQDHDTECDTYVMLGWN